MLSNITFTKITTFIKSLFWHIYSGSPKSTQYEINKRLKICLDCAEFDNKHNECKICGCSISSEIKFMNKLAWADQKCPLNKW